jgi:hypothetical protein
MSSVRNFGIALHDALGTKLTEQYQAPLEKQVILNAGTTFPILIFVLLLTNLVMAQREGETPEPINAPAPAMRGAEVPALRPGVQEPDRRRSIASGALAGSWP